VLNWTALGTSGQEIDHFTLQSRVPLLQWTSTVPTGGLLPLTVTGKPGNTYILESSSDLVAWSSVATNTIPAGGPPTFTNLFPTGASQSFFRAWAKP
jgi:hypothetical protein